VDTKEIKIFMKLRKLIIRNYAHILLSLFIIPTISLFSLAAGTGVVSELDGMQFEQTVSNAFAKPGDKLNFTITYSNTMSETAYNVTIFEWVPAGLTFVTSKPFYDGASDPDAGFYQWSRGNLLPGQNGSIVIKAVVNNVPVGTTIMNTVQLAYENEERIEVTSDVKVTVTQAAGVEVLPDQIHSVPPSSGAWTEYNITLTNTGNGIDAFDISLRSVAYNPSGSSHNWTIKLYNSTGYTQNAPVATVYDNNSEDSSSWTEHGVLTNVILESGESTWYIVKVIEAEGTSGSGDAYLDFQLVATSLLDPNVSDMSDETTIVKSVAGLTLAPDNLRYANPGESIVYYYILVNNGQTEVIDLDYTSPWEWEYSFWLENGTALVDTDGSGNVDVGTLPKNAYVYVLVKVTVPHNTPAGTIVTAVVTATGVTSGSYDVASDTTNVKSAPVLSLDKKLVSENPIYEGDVVTYEIRIVNLGNTRLTGFLLDDAFETLSLDFSGSQPSESSYDEIAGTILWENLGALEPGQEITVTVNFVAAAGDDMVRQSANVIDAEDEFGNLISIISVNRELRIIGSNTLTVTASANQAVGGSFSTTWTEHGVQKEGVFATPQSMACDQGTTATVSSPESPLNNGNVRYVFDSYSPSGTVIMDYDKTVTINYLTEYALTFEQIGSGEPVYITVDGAQLSEALPQLFWVEESSTISFSYPPVITDDDGTTRYVLTGVSGSTTDASVTVNAPTVVTGFFKTQYHLTVATDPEGLGAPQYSGWYDSGTYADIEVERLTGGDGASTRYRFEHWIGEGIINSTNSSSQIVMDAPKTATALFVKQFYITIISLHGSPTSSQWVDSGKSLTAIVVSPTEIVSNQTQWKCVGLSVDGVIETVNISYTFENIQEPHIVEFYWVEQFWLQVDTAVSGTSVEGTGWYDSGTSATISTTPYQPSTTHRFVFVSWTSIGQNEALITDPAASGTTVLMDSYYVVQANWQEQWYVTVISSHDDPTPSRWVNTGESLTVSVTTPADNNGAGTRYRCIGYRIDAGSLLEGASCTLINVHAAHRVEFEWKAQYYLTMSTNLGVVSPHSGWYNAGSTVSIEAFAPAATEGKGYVWHRWAGTGTGSYSGIQNPATVTIEKPISETAYWKIEPILTVKISSETIANGHKIVILGQTDPVQPGLDISLIYELPNGTQINRIVYINDEGLFEDAFDLDQDYLYDLFVDRGTWKITAIRPSDAIHEVTEASATLKVEPQISPQINPLLIVVMIISVGAIVYLPPSKRIRNNGHWSRIVLVLSLAGLALGAASLALDWLSVAGTVTTFDATYKVEISLYPFRTGLVSITEGLQYTGREMPSLVNQSLQSVIGSSGPVSTVFLVPIGCVLSLSVFYRPKNTRKRKFKAAVLIIAGILVIISVVHTSIFVQGQTSIISGASTGYGAGPYLALLGGALTILSGLFTTREKHNNANKT